MMVHLSTCPTCRLTTAEPTPSAETEWVRSSAPPAADAQLPPVLREARLGKWRPIALGVRAARLKRVSGIAQSVQLVEAAPGAIVPLPQALELLVAIGGGLRGDAGDLTSGGLAEITRHGFAKADPGAGFLGLAVGSDHLYQGRWSHPVSTR